VNSRFHPEIGEEHSAIFSPWTFVDTLLAIELVRGEAYYRQFAVSDDADVAAGLKVFRQACQSCHGARKLGGAFGWDFVEPEPIVSRVKVGRLLFHVLYRATSEVLRGAQMPAIGFVNEEDARKLYVWLKAIADKPLQPYAP
jgi:mono/diheme cytochrome c family protein